jgi:poly(A) RNA polymerase GLD2
LETVRRLLRRHCGDTFRANIELIPAKVPILKFRERREGTEVDLCVNNPTSIRNTHLLFYYCKCDARN